MERVEEMVELLNDFAWENGLEPSWWYSAGRGGSCYAFRSSRMTAVAMLARLVVFAENEGGLDTLFPYLSSVGSNGCAGDEVLYFPGVPANDEEEEIEEAEEAVNF